MALIFPGGAKNISLIPSEMDPNLQPWPFLRLWNARLTTASLDWKQRAPFVFINGDWGKLGLHKVDGLPLGWWCIVVISGKPCIPWLLKPCTIAPKILICHALGQQEPHALWLHMYLNWCTIWPQRCLQQRPHDWTSDAEDHFSRNFYKDHTSYTR